MDITEQNKKRHSLAHLLAAAVLKIYPDTLLTIGPAIENGFYYDFEFSSPVSEKDLDSIEKEMKKLLPDWKSFEKIEVSPEEAREIFRDNEYKLELIDEIEKKGEQVTLYYSGEKNSVPEKSDILKAESYKLKAGFLDLCRGGHVENPAKEIEPDSFKLDRIAGAYWRGDENNKMLTRIYGLAYDTEEELDQFLAKREEMAKRDHRKIGKELGLFTFSDLVGAGLPLFTPKGTALRQALFDRLLKISKRYDMQPVTIPHMAKKKLYEISGHAEKFGDELLIVKSHYGEFILKPVNCPHHTQIYAGEPRSYRDLPLRFMESTMQYRDEQPGEIGGLTRTRGFTVDDGHIFCRIDQVDQEAKNIAEIIKEFYGAIGLWGNHWVSLSVRDPENLQKYIGNENDWKEAEKMLQKVSDDLGLNAKRQEGEAALYGPKLDFMFKDALGRERQLSTIQIDFAMPKRFELEYTDKDGTKKTPVMIHRAILGSYERFMAILIEHFAGAFPFWLSSIQVKVLPVNEKHLEYAENIFQKLKDNNFRVEIDRSDENLGKKVRQAKVEKVPYFLVIGDKEIESGGITIESREAEKETLKLEDLIYFLNEKNN